jgi:hypothetical protein
LPPIGIKPPLGANAPLATFFVDIENQIARGSFLIKLPRPKAEKSGPSAGSIAATTTDTTGGVAGMDHIGGFALTFLLRGNDRAEPANNENGLPL